MAPTGSGAELANHKTANQEGPPFIWRYSMAKIGNTLTAKVKIKGDRPLFWHRFGPEALPLEKQEKTGVAGHDPEEWRRTVLVTKDGQLFIEGTYVFGAVREAAKFHKIGRKSAVSFIAATLQVAEDRIMVDRWFPGYPNGSKFDSGAADVPPEDADEPVYLDIRGVRNPTTRARNVRYRVAASPGWLAEFTLVWDKTIVDRNLMHSILIDAGRLVGVGNARAIGMGRFTVTDFEIVE